MKKNHKAVQSSEKYKFTTSVPLKNLSTGNQYCLPLLPTLKCYFFQIKIFFNFLLALRPHQNKTTWLISIAGNQINGNIFFWQNNEVYQKFIYEKSISFVSLIMLYDHRNTIMYKALGPIIYNNRDKFICLGYLCLCQ